MPTIVTNKRVAYDYQIIKDFEAGIVLSGAEVKSVKKGQINLKGSYVSLRNGELWLIKTHISPYAMATNQGDYDPTRDRKLLLKRKEIDSLIGQLKSHGLTVLPHSVYTKGSLIKVKLCLCRGKKAHDKRESIKKKESDRRLRRLMRNKT